ncbi:MAG: hypothetical protein FWG82_01930 [Oscillospiraceae bacterium]|nr:hypothetical protein [Oscillospiraceae bacterium]
MIEITEKISDAFKAVFEYILNWIKDSGFFSNFSGIFSFLDDFDVDSIFPSE